MAAAAKATPESRRSCQTIPDIYAPTARSNLEFYSSTIVWVLSSFYKSGVRRQLTWRLRNLNFAGEKYVCPSQVLAPESFPETVSDWFLPVFTVNHICSDGD